MLNLILAAIAASNFVVSMECPRAYTYKGKPVLVDIDSVEVSNATITTLSVTCAWPDTDKEPITRKINCAKTRPMYTSMLISNSLFVNLYCKE